ncbi:putative signal peptide secreted protein [Cryptosporidium canis]|nr:putative signal peptide secreted protein [Cryptosporidium canis]
MKYISLPLFLIFASLTLHIFHYSDLSVVCEAPQQPDEEVPSTSGTSSAAGPSHSMDAGPTPSSSARLGKVNREALELRLSNLYVETLMKAAELSRSTLVGDSDGEEDEDTTGETSARTRVYKKMRLSPPEGPSGDAASPSSELPKEFLELFDEFLRRYLLDLIVVELEIGLFSAINLYYSPLWIERRGIRGDMKFLFVLVDHWGDKSTPQNGAIKRKMLKYFDETKIARGSRLFSAYKGDLTTTSEMLYRFYYSRKELKCSDVKLSLGILFLIFKNNKEMLFSSYLFFLLICSLRELYGFEFYRGFNVFRKNIDVKTKILNIGGSHVMDLCKEMRGCVSALLGMRLKKPALPVSRPLEMGAIHVPSFGLRLCLALLELHVIEIRRFDMSHLVLFFGSRMESAPEVFLAFDILSILKSLRDQLLDVIVSLIYDESTLSYLTKRIMGLHGIDISTLKEEFGQCIEAKDKYRELSGLVLLTDFQRGSIVKQRERKKHKKKQEKK